MTEKTKEEGCLWFIWRLTLVFIIIPGISLVVVIPIAEYVEGKWGQCVNVRIAAWMNSVSMVRRGGKEWPISEECKNALCRGNKSLSWLLTAGTAALFVWANHRLIVIGAFV